MNIPAAISMITTSFPDPAERARAYAIYSALGAIGNVCGFVLGGVLTARLSWRWGEFIQWFHYLSSRTHIQLVFYLLAILIIPFALASWFVLPNHKNHSTERKSLDWPGVFSLTVGLILFVFAISEGSTGGTLFFYPLSISAMTYSFGHDSLGYGEGHSALGPVDIHVCRISSYRANCRGSCPSTTNMVKQELHSAVLLWLEHILVGVWQ